MTFDLHGFIYFIQKGCLIVTYKKTLVRVNLRKFLTVEDEVCLSFSFK
jgi:hypothetical protein